MLAAINQEKVKTKVLIVDDEELARKRISDLISDKEAFEVIGECSSGREAIEAIENGVADLVFLDIQMQDMDGFDVLANFETTNLPKIIFVTAYDQYALKAFEFHAIDYLLKPFDDERFEEMLEHAQKELSKEEIPSLVGKLSSILSRIEEMKSESFRENLSEDGICTYPKKLVIKSTGKVEFVNVADISSINAEGSYVKLNTNGKSHLMRGSLKDLEQKLDPDVFMRIHRSTIVNLQYIKELKPHFHGEYVVILSNGTRLKLSRNYRKSAERILGGEF